MAEKVWKVLICQGRNYERREKVHEKASNDRNKIVQGKTGKVESDTGEEV